jgi:hypothetical protein
MKVAKFAVLAGIAVIPCGIVLADTPTPHQKAGLWESSMTMMGKPFTTQSCVTAESEAKLSVFSAHLRQKNCSSATIAHNADGSWSSTSTCKFGGKEHTTHATITGDFDSKITLVASSDGGGAHDVNMTMTWLGPCKPGMRGGDVIMSNGMKMNAIDGTMSGVPSH